MEILKQLREKAVLTQEEVAEKLDVSLSSIQNWERTGKISKEALHNLLDLYQVSKETRNHVVLQVFGDDREADGPERPYTFPDFLFDEGSVILETARNAIATPEDMEILGYYLYISEECHTYEVIPWIDYGFFQTYGGYLRVMNRIERLRDLFHNLEEEVVEWGIAHPGEPFVLTEQSARIIGKWSEGWKEYSNGVFSKIYQLKSMSSPRYIGEKGERLIHYGSGYKLLETIFGSFRFSSNLEDEEIRSMEEALQKEYNGCLCFALEEESDPAYLQEKEQYLLDIKNYMEDPKSHSEAPVFKVKYGYYLKLTERGKQFLEWLDKNSVD